MSYSSSEFRVQEAGNNIVFIIGSQRSGTTLLCDLIGRHPDVGAWIEPNFIWDWHCNKKDSDVLTAADATPQLIDFVKKEYDFFLRKSRKRVLVDKTPENSFRIPCVNEVFPEAKWINIVRDGRDVVLSIQRESERRHNFTKDFNSFINEVRLALSEQPFWRNRIQEIWFELKNNRSFNPKNYLNKSKWKNSPGIWGARFPGWRHKVQQMDMLEFFALQWVKTIEHVEKDRQLLSSGNVMDVSYEQILADPETEMAKIFSFIGLEYGSLERICQGILKSNTKKWKTFYNQDELQRVHHIQLETLLKLGYLID